MQPPAMRAWQSLQLPHPCVQKSGATFDLVMRSLAVSQHPEMRGRPRVCIACRAEPPRLLDTG